MFLAKSSIISFIPPETIPILIVLLSIVAFTIIIERSVYFGRLGKLKTKDVRTIRDYLRNSQWNEALDILSQFKRNPGASVVTFGIQHKLEGSEHVREEMETEGYQQISKMEKFLTGLGTIATISPLMGVLGTVVGMIRSFEEGTGTKSAEVGISEALITTAMGLCVAIPAYIFYNYFVRKKEDRIIEMENIIDQALDIMDPEEN